ncbi:U8-agatoxin-Ao1a [Chionoecetes opilio]|uniref:U8-agatoxin-Ao1a n=1 Tax=Chionoecetes opilio TaxID=41210 RepID=A0A8J4YGM4_CHIOP|nr:U8-agatoxin-Ao1a [Chionoecetes opilio]
MMRVVGGGEAGGRGRCLISGRRRDARRSGREPDGLQQQNEVDYTADLLDHLLGRSQKRSDPAIYLFRRSCIRRGGACDHRPDDCCYNSSCRCNLWGTNCRCMRMGLFQQWGK